MASPALTNAPASALRLGEILLQDGVVDESDLTRALELQQSLSARIGEILVRLGATTDDLVYQALARQLELDFMPELDDTVLESAAETAQAAQAIAPMQTWRAIGWFPLRLESEPTLLTADPLNPAAQEYLARKFPNYQRVLTQPTEIQRLFELLDGGPSTGDDAATSTALEGDLRRMAEQAPIIELVNTLFANAIRLNASDVHVEPFEDQFQIRLRVDGTLRLWKTIDEATFMPVVSRIKLLSNMDIGEKRKPQDGRQTIKVAGREMDLRVSSLPGPHGESLVMRMLEKARRIPDFVALGMTEGQARDLQGLLGHQNGLIVVTGPTGSGKSTTLYRALSELNNGHRKIITIEDPIEYKLSGVNQTQVQADIGYTFASGLRSILRQDPDVVMVGEIRDPETAQIAIQASLTGHLVLSTLHTNTALGAIPRLLDLGVEPFLLGSALRGVLAQRLLRQLCDICATPADAPAAAVASRMAELDTSSARWREPVGCEACGQVGYKGRVAVYEIAVVDDPLRRAIASMKPEPELSEIALKAGYRPMQDMAAHYAATGRTTLVEMQRVLGQTDYAKL
jgi:general secretion pathway protein E